jgi:hypothetical protein
MEPVTAPQAGERKSEKEPPVVLLDDDDSTLASFSIDPQMAKDMSVDGSYERKVALINREIVRMGFGKFQWWLFFLSGGGWAV